MLIKQLKPFTCFRRSYKMTKQVLILAVLAVGSVFAQTIGPVRINMPDSTYHAQLRGKSGTRTAAQIYQGTWNGSSSIRSFEFYVTVTGRYDLYIDPAGGSSYSLQSTWGKTPGKMVIGTDLGTILEKANGSLQWLNTALATGSVKSTQIYDGTIEAVDLMDSLITLAKISHTLKDYIDASGGGTITNFPDDETIKEKGSHELYAVPATVPVAFAAGDSLPSVADTTAHSFKTANTAATTIRGFPGAINGRRFNLLFGDDSTTVADNDSLALPGDLELQFNSGDIARFWKVDGVVRLEEMQIF